MTESYEGLTKVQGRDEIYMGLGEFVPPGWEWTTSPVQGWNPEKIGPNENGLVVMCRPRRKFWNAKHRELDVNGHDVVDIYGGDELVFSVHEGTATGLAGRVTAFLNGEDPHQLIVYSIADASRNTGQNMMPHIQECVRLAADTRARIKSYG